MKFQISGFTTLTTLATLLFLGTWATPGIASEDGYGDWDFTASYVRGTYDIDNVVDSSINIVDFRVGYMFSDYLGLEGRFGFGINDGTENLCTYNDNNEFVCDVTGINLDHHFGAYARGYFMKPGWLRPYGLLGFSKGKASINANGAMYDRSESGVSYGLGLEMGQSKARFILEYMSMFDTNGTSLNGVSVGLRTRF